MSPCHSRPSDFRVIYSRGLRSGNRVVNVKRSRAADYYRFRLKKKNTNNNKILYGYVGAVPAAVYEKFHYPRVPAGRISDVRPTTAAGPPGSGRRRIRRRRRRHKPVDMSRRRDADTRACGHTTVSSRPRRDVTRVRRTPTARRHMSHVLSYCRIAEFFYSFKSPPVLRDFSSKRNEN